MADDYPGQAYFHAHNANIRRAEENFMAKAQPTDALRELGPCGRHPRKIAETPSQAWYRAYESTSADKDPSQHCPECDRDAVRTLISEAVGGAFEAAAEHFAEFWRALCDLEPSVKYLETSARKLEREIKNLSPTSAQAALAERDPQAQFLAKYDGVCPCCRNAKITNSDKGNGVPCPYCVTGELSWKQAERDKRVREQPESRVAEAITTAYQRGFAAAKEMAARS